MGNKRQSFSKEFKERAVSHWLNSDKTAAEVAANLGIPDAKYLTRWKKRMDKKGDDAFPGNGKLSGKEAEMAKLKKQLKDTEIERDILKKAVGIFSRL
jgi:transposase